jgi:predicted phosphoribosyltransferase
MAARTATLFDSRADAGRQLAALVDPAWFADLLILALPRGGVPIGAELARALSAELDVLATRKIGLPWRPEQGVGAVVAGADPVYDPVLLRQAGLEQEDLAPLARREQAEAARRRDQYRGDRPPPRIAGRAVIVADDGLATGVTARAALAAVAAQSPSVLVLAVPVAAEDTAEAIERDLAPVIAVHRLAVFGAVGRWYAMFPQVSDAEVLALLG